MELSASTGYDEPRLCILVLIPETEAYETNKFETYPCLLYTMSELAFRVVVFQDRKAPTYSTPPKPIHKIKIESSSTGSSFPAVIALPVPKAVGSLCRELGQ